MIGCSFTACQSIGDTDCVWRKRIRRVPKEYFLWWCWSDIGQLPSHRLPLSLKLVLVPKTRRALIYSLDSFLFIQLWLPLEIQSHLVTLCWHTTQLFCSEVTDLSSICFLNNERCHCLPTTIQWKCQSNEFKGNELYEYQQNSVNSPSVVGVDGEMWFAGHFCQVLDHRFAVRGRNKWNENTVVTVDENQCCQTPHRS